MRILFLSLIFTFLLPITVFAQGAAPNDLVSVRLVPETQTVKGGDELWIGIEQAIKPHWHTYWKNPGDSGSAPIVTWSAPDGFAPQDILFATPKKLPFQGLLNYGYEGQTVMLQKLRIPQNIPAGAITLTADLDILVCKEECIPVAITETITLNAPNTISGSNAAFISAAQEKLPKAIKATTAYSGYNDSFNLIVNAIDGVSIHNIVPQSVTFFPANWGIVKNAAAAEVKIKNGTLVLTQARGERPITDITAMRGVFAFADNAGKNYAINITANPLPKIAATMNAVGGAPTSGAAATPAKPVPTNLTAFSALFFAFIGGLILNLMPCVFPVLSLKALSLVNMHDKERGAVRRGGLAYMAGIVLTFIAIAGTLLILKSFGAQIGWGFQLQNPIIVALLAYTLFLVGLNFYGAFDISLGQIGGGKLSQKLTSGSSTRASFFTGVLATIVAAPCVAPFMASAIGYALTRSAPETLLVFAALGVGLAAPYVALCYVPRLRGFMPKPGAWMNTFKEFLAFPMFASAAWLVWVMTKQTGTGGLLGVLFGITALGFGVWLIGLRPSKGQKGRKRMTVLIALSVLAAAGFLPVGYGNNTAQTQEEATPQAEKFGEAYSPAILQEALQTNDPVFVEMTAAWCITCKVNYKTSLNIKSTKQFFTDKNVRYLIGDWTNQDPEITKFLTKYGRSGVPIYVFYGAPDGAGNRPEPKVLPQILTPKIVANAVRG